MKKIFVLLLFICLFMFSACGGRNLIVDVTEVKLSETDLELEVGQSSPINVEVLPSNSTDKSIKWESTNPAVADYLNGEIIALSEGNCIIKATSSNDIVASCFVKVKKQLTSPTSISFEEDSYGLAQNQKKYTELIFSPSYVENLKGSVTVENKNICEASYEYDLANQKIKIWITGKNIGETTVTVKTEAGKTCSCKIKVYENQTKYVTINSPSLPKTVGWVKYSGSGYYAKARIDKCAIEKEQVAETLVKIIVTIYCTKTYDADGSTGTDLIRFKGLIYNEKGLSGTEDLSSGYSYRYIVGETFTMTWEFYVTTEETKYRTLSFDFSDFK